ncbi:MAG: efflux RND transporter periplasmic adaptor subunit [Bacteroidaceae bacterium]|nr:efflux RND transporter periplasmic adaptor subunit [Bacteroidaceae bacterium]MBR6857234.1 efflux RND transporter periplasmic adaptor subunit [Bacteroidaceae bacterium]
MKKVIKYIVVALIAVVFIGTFVFLYKNSQPEEIRYQELPAQKQDVARSTVLTGKIVPRNEVNIKPQINGIIAEIYKEAGQMVQQGEVIARLTVIPDMNSLSAAQSRVRLSEINLKQAQTNFDREKALYEKNLISAEEYEKTEQALSQAKEEYAASQESLEVIRDGVSSKNATSSSTLIRSTITGLILDIPVKVGNSVIQANTLNDGTTVATVANMNDLIFEGQIDETEVGSLYEGMPLTITIGALKDYTFDADLEYISPKAVENNGANQFKVKAAVKVDSEHTIRSGYSANAQIDLEKATNVLTVPESALEFVKEESYVYKKGQDGTYTMTKVQTGLSDGVNIEIKEGLSEGDTVRGPRIIEDETTQETTETTETAEQEESTDNAE